MALESARAGRKPARAADCPPNAPRDEARGTVVENSKHQHERLVIETGENEGLVFPLRESIVSIGRGPENTIQIIDAHMSRNHTLLINHDGSWFLRDLGSRNGTQVNGFFIKTDYCLSHGDRLLIGNTTFVFERDDHSSKIDDPSSSTGVRVSNENESMFASQVMKLREELGNDNEMTGGFGVPTHDRARLNMLYRVGEIISSTLDLDELLENVLDVVQKCLTPDRASILLHDARYKVLLPKALRRPLDSRDDIVISHSIIDQAIEEQAALLVGDASHDTRFRQSDSIVKHCIHSAICVPFIYRDELLGVLYLDRREHNGLFDENDLRLVCGIANHAALAIANSRLHQRLLLQHGKERELEIARTIQQNLLPKAMPELQDFQIYGISEAALEVGGDYFDVIGLPDGRYVLAIADVSGKGVPAAILIASVRAAVQVEVRNMGGDELVEVVNRLNQMVCRDTSGAMFVTMILALLDPIARTLTYCNAGHVHPLLCKPNGEIESLDVGGCFLGIMPGLAYEQGVVALEDGAALLMYSDGVTDTMNEAHELFGLQRLTDFLATAGGMTAEAICKGLEHEAAVYRGGEAPFDDLTLLALKVSSGASA